jgi:hypothetical protein
VSLLFGAAGGYLAASPIRPWRYGWWWPGSYEWELRPAILAVGLVGLLLIYYAWRGWLERPTWPKSPRWPGWRTPPSGRSVFIEFVLIGGGTVLAELGEDEALGHARGVGLKPPGVEMRAYVLGGLQDWISERLAKASGEFRFTDPGGHRWILPVSSVLAASVLDWATSDRGTGSGPVTP